MSKLCKELWELNMGKPNHPINRKAQWTQITVHKRRNTIGQQILEKVFNMLSYLGNANSNCFENPSYSGMSGHHNESNYNECWCGDGGSNSYPWIDVNWPNNYYGNECGGFLKTQD